MKQITKSKIFYYSFTAMIAIPLIFMVIFSCSQAYYDIIVWKISRLFTSKYWFGRRLARRHLDNFYFCECEWLLEQRGRWTKRFHNGYELTLKL